MSVSFSLTDKTCACTQNNKVYVDEIKAHVVRVLQFGIRVTYALTQHECLLNGSKFNQMVGTRELTPSNEVCKGIFRIS